MLWICNDVLESVAVGGLHQFNCILSFAKIISVQEKKQVLEQ